MKAPRLRRLLLPILVPPALFLAWLSAVWPPPIWYRSHWPSETAFMSLRRADGQTDGRAAAANRKPAVSTVGLPVGSSARQYVPLDSIAPAMQEAAIIGEDSRFWTHGGVDFNELRRAVGYRRARFEWTSPRDRAELMGVLSGVWGRRDALRGASTITQQLAKNLYLSPSRNPLRKLKEAVTAYRLESALGKRRVLELYLNVAELGNDVWGVEAASRRYFATSARRLTITQATALAASLPFPLRSNPGYRPLRMRRRQDLLLRRMRGEPIEIPKVEEEPIAQPGDSILWTPGIDSLMDSLRAPVETLSAIGYPLSVRGRGVPVHRADS